MSWIISESISTAECVNIYRDDNGEAENDQKYWVEQLSTVSSESRSASGSFGHQGGRKGQITGSMTSG